MTGNSCPIQFSHEGMARAARLLGLERPDQETLHDQPTSRQEWVHSGHQAPESHAAGLIDKSVSHAAFGASGLPETHRSVAAASNDDASLQAQCQSDQHDLLQAQSTGALGGLFTTGNNRPIQFSHEGMARAARLLGLEQPDQETLHVHPLSRQEWSHAGHQPPESHAAGLAHYQGSHAFSGAAGPQVEHTSAAMASNGNALAAEAQSDEHELPQPSSVPAGVFHFGCKQPVHISSAALQMGQQIMGSVLHADSDATASDHELMQQEGSSAAAAEPEESVHHYEINAADAVISVPSVLPQDRHAGLPLLDVPQQQHPAATLAKDPCIEGVQSPPVPATSATQTASVAATDGNTPEAEAESKACDVILSTPGEKPEGLNAADDSAAPHRPPTDTAGGAPEHSRDAQSPTQQDSMPPTLAEAAQHACEQEGPATRAEIPPTLLEEGWQQAESGQVAAVSSLEAPVAGALPSTLVELCPTVILESPLRDESGNDEHGNATADAQGDGSSIHAPPVWGTASGKPVHFSRENMRAAAAMFGSEYPADPPLAQAGLSPAPEAGEAQKSVPRADAAPVWGTASGKHVHISREKMRTAAAIFGDNFPGAATQAEAGAFSDAAAPISCHTGPDKPTEMPEEDQAQAEEVTGAIKQQGADSPQIRSGSAAKDPAPAQHSSISAPVTPFEPAGVSLQGARSLIRNRSEDGLATAESTPFRGHTESGAGSPWQTASGKRMKVSPEGLAAAATILHSTAQPGAASRRPLPPALSGTKRSRTSEVQATDPAEQAAQHELPQQSAAMTESAAALDPTTPMQSRPAGMLCQLSSGRTAGRRRTAGPRSAQPASSGPAHSKGRGASVFKAPRKFMTPVSKFALQQVQTLAALSLS